jgi:DNA-binding MarR family transcriptional regulator
MDSRSNCQPLDNVADAIYPEAMTPAPEHRLGFLLYRVGLAIQRAYEAGTAERGLKPSEAGILSSLAADGAQHVRGLGRRLGMGRQTVVNVSEALAARGLIDKRPDPDDARAVVLTITPAGQAALAASLAATDAFEAALAAPLGPERAAALQRDLSVLLASRLLALKE